MALQLGALRDALIEAGASEEAANKAAEEAAGFETRLSSIEGKLTLLIWAVGVNVAATIAVFGAIVALSGQIARLHG
jgi:hypothetical protein